MDSLLDNKRILYIRDLLKSELNMLTNEFKRINKTLVSGLTYREYIIDTEKTGGLTKFTTKGKHIPKIGVIPDPRDIIIDRMKWLHYELKLTEN